MIFHFQFYCHRLHLYVYFLNFYTNSIKANQNEKNKGNKLIMSKSSRKSREEDEEYLEKVETYVQPKLRKTSNNAPSDAENYDDEPDESFSERLWGLTEMFPDPLRNLTGKVADLTMSSVKGLYTFSCNASWIFFTSSVILFAPVIFETERAQMEEMQKSQQKQVLLGPGSAMSAGGVPAMPPMVR